MPGVNVYLPDDLHIQVKELGLSVAPICQKALRQEIERMETARMEASGGIESVAARLRKTRDEEERRIHDRGRKAGDVWARRYATWDELEGVDELTGTIQLDDGDAFFSISQSGWLDEEVSGWVVQFDIDTESTAWEGFIEGAVAVREAARGLLD